MDLVQLQWICHLGPSSSRLNGRNHFTAKSFIFFYISHHLIGDSLLFYFFLFPPSPHWSLSFLSFYFFLFPSFFSFLSISLSLFPTLPTFLSVSSSFAFSIQPTFLSIPIFISFSHSAHLTYLSHSTLSRSLIISQSLQAAVD